MANETTDKKPPRYRVRASLPDGMFQVSKPKALVPPEPILPITGAIPEWIPPPAPENPPSAVEPVAGSGTGPAAT